VRGAGGVPVDQQVEPQQNGEGTREISPIPADGGDGDRRDGRGKSTEEDLSDGGAPEGAAVARRPAQPVHHRAIAFLRASWAELQRVQWPDRRHVTQATTVVLGFVAVSGIYLGAADWVAQKIVNFVL
jgi:preprotein translocase SecE subunit